MSAPDANDIARKKGPSALRSVIDGGDELLACVQAEVASVRTPAAAQTWTHRGAPRRSVIRPTTDLPATRAAACARPDLSAGVG